MLTRPQSAFATQRLIYADVSKQELYHQITQLMTKLYSQRAISIATFFGGPLAAGILARQNFINLGKDDYGKYSLIIGIVSTILIYLGIFSLPEPIIDKIPNVLIPAIYTGIIYFIIERLQGSELADHKNNNGEFYSAWKAAGIGAICMTILLIGIFGYVYSKSGVIFPTGKFDVQYDNGIARFNKNEEKALTLFTILESDSSSKSISFIDKVGIPTWEENLQILEELDKIDGLYPQLKKQDQILRNYCNLRIETFKLIRKALVENTNAYDQQIENINKKIDLEVSKL